MLTNDVVSFEQPGPEMKKVELANWIDADEAAHKELPHLDYTVYLLLFEFSV